VKFAYSWLKEWVDPGMPADALAHRITMAGLEVDGIEADGEGLDGVVVAEVLSAEKQPDADRLSVCQVSTGEGEPVEVVCGAPNVRAGLKTPLAPPGTRLPNGMKLRRSKIRGVVSNGMLCSAVELGLGSESDGILELPDDAPAGTPLTEYLSLPDAVLDVDLTPNRGDCFSVLGIARDVSALVGKPLTGPEMPTHEAAIDRVYPVERPEPDACPRFAHCVVEGIDPTAASPLWMTERLRKSGLRAIHPVVDVTNYVMLELGQPLHGYDTDRLNGPVRPRFAKAGESVTLLDDSTVELKDDTIVITDDSGVIGLAGIMGGKSTMVQDDTANVFFEAAFWPRDFIAGRARSYGMHTDASVRFERGVDPALQARAVERASELLVRIAGGKAGPLVDDVDQERLPARQAISLTAKRLRQALGTDFAADEVTSILTALGLEVEAGEGRWAVVPPSFRFDIALEDDLVEEVARVYGYDRIPESTETASLPLRPVPEAVVEGDAIAATLVARDYTEVITWSFVDAKSNEIVSGETSELVLENPISSELGVMRSSLWSGMLTAASGNVARQQDRVRLFELGRSYHGSVEAPVETRRVAGLLLGPALEESWASARQAVDFFDLKGDVEALLDTTGRAQEFAFEAFDHLALQPGQSARLVRDGSTAGVLGKVHPKVLKHFSIKQEAFVFELDVETTFAAQIPAAKPVSKYPAVRRDIAVLVAEAVRGSELVNAVYEAEPDLVKEVRIFDVYQGEGIEAGLKSVALGLILQETSRTLTDDDADAAVAAAVQKLKQDFDADLRD